MFEHIYTGQFTEAELKALKQLNIPSPYEFTPGNILFFSEFPKKLVDDATRRTSQLIKLAKHPANLDTLRNEDIDQVTYSYSWLISKSIDWNQYFDLSEIIDVIDVNQDPIRHLVERDVDLMREIYFNADLMEKVKFRYIAAKYNEKKGEDICVQLLTFRNLICEMQIKQVDQNIVKNFRALVIQIETELLEQYHINLNHYSTTLTEFSDLATALIKNNLQPGALEGHARRLVDLTIPKINKPTPPMSPALKGKICLAFGMVVGAVIGFAIGALITFWGAGFGGIAGAIAGATIAQAIILGGATLAGAGILGGGAYYYGEKHALTKLALFKATIKIMPSEKLKDITNEAIKAVKSTT